MKELIINEDIVFMLIDEWHESDSELKLHEYLGFSKEEYKQFIDGNYKTV